MESLLWSGRRLIGSGARRRAVSGQRSAQAPGRPIPQSAALLILPQKSTETADLLSHQSSPVLSAPQRPDRAPNIAEHNGRIIRWSRRRTKRCATRWSPRTWQARPCDDCSRSFPDQLDLALPGGLGQRVAGVTRRAPGARPGDTSRGAAPAWGATPGPSRCSKLRSWRSGQTILSGIRSHLEIAGIIAHHARGPSPRCSRGVLVRWAVHGCLGHRLRTNRSKNELAIAMQRGRNGWG